MKLRLIILTLIFSNLTLFSQNVTNIKEDNPNIEIFSLIDSSKLSLPYFSVQIGVFKKMIDSKNPITKYSLIFYKDNDLIKYFVGKYIKYSSALNMKNSLITEGNPDVFIVCFGIKNNDNIETQDKFDLINDEELDSLIDTPALVNYDSNLRYESTNTEGIYQENYSLNDDAIETLSNTEENLFQNKLDSNKILNSVNFIVDDEDDFIFENAKESLNDTIQIDTNIKQILKNSIKKINLDSIRKLDSIKIINDVELDTLIGTPALVNYDSNLRYESTNTEGIYQENYSLNDDAIETLSNTEENLFQNKLDSNKILNSVNFIVDDEDDFIFENAKESLNDTIQIDTNIKQILKNSIKKINLDSIRKLDSIKIINNKIQKFIALTNPSDPEQFMSNITYLDPKLRTSSISDSSEFQEVFYTIQLGAYSKPLTPPNYIFKFPLFMSEHNSLFKYCNGKFQSLAEAKEKRDEFQLYGIYDAFIISYGIPSKDSYLYDKESKEIDLELDSLENSRIDKIKLNDPDAIFYSEKDTSSLNKKFSEKDLNKKSNYLFEDSISTDSDLINLSLLNDSLEKDTSIKSSDNELKKDSLNNIIYAKNVNTNSINDSLEKETKKNTFRIIDLDYQVPNVYYIELGIFKSSKNTVMSDLKIKLPYLNISSRKRFMGYQYYSKKYNSLLNAQKALDEIYENDIINARIIKSTSSQYKNNYEFRVLIDIANSINSKKIQDKIFFNYKILKGNYHSKINYFSLSRDDYNDVLNDQNFFKENDFIKCKVVVFQNGKESTVEKANMEQKY